MDEQFLFFSAYDLILKIYSGLGRCNERRSRQVFVVLVINTIGKVADCVINRDTDLTSGPITAVQFPPPPPTPPHPRLGLHVSQYSGKIKVEIIQPSSINSSSTIKGYVPFVTLYRPICRLSRSELYLTSYHYAFPGSHWLGNRKRGLNQFSASPLVQFSLNGTLWYI